MAKSYYSEFLKGPKLFCCYRNKQELDGLEVSQNFFYYNHIYFKQFDHICKILCEYK